MHSALKSSQLQDRAHLQEQQGDTWTTSRVICWELEYVSRKNG